MCPVRSMGWSNLNVTVEADEGVSAPFQLETSTDGVESESLTCDPGRKATVLAHSDRAFDASGIHAGRSGDGHIFKSSTWIKMIGASGSF